MFCHGYIHVYVCGLPWSSLHSAPLQIVIKTKSYINVLFFYNFILIHFKCLLSIIWTE